MRGQNPEKSTVTVIQDRMIDKSSNASRLVDKLYKKGLVSREECKSDRRQLDVMITDKGLKLLEELESKVDKLHIELESISEKEAKAVNDVLDWIHSDKE